MNARGAVRWFILSNPSLPNQDDALEVSLSITLVVCSHHFSQRIDHAIPRKGIAIDPP